MTKDKSKPSPIDTTSDDFKNAVDLLAVHTEASNRLATLEADANEAYLEIIDEARADYAHAQKAATDSELALELIALRHPEWFNKGKRSVTTPYGTLSLKESSKLEIPNEEATIARLELLAAKKPEFKFTDYTRQKTECNKESLEKLDDSTLTTLGITRVTGDKFTVKPAKLKMGKAIEAAAKQDEAQKLAA